MDHEYGAFGVSLECAIDQDSPPLLETALELECVPVCISFQFDKLVSGEINSGTSINRDVLPCLADCSTSGTGNRDPSGKRALVDVVLVLFCPFE